MSIEETIEAAVARGVERALDRLMAVSCPRLVDREGAARILGCDPSSVDKLRVSGDLPVVLNERPGVKRPKPMFDVRDLERWIAANKRVDGD